MHFVPAICIAFSTEQRQASLSCPCTAPGCGCGEPDTPFLADAPAGQIAYALAPLIASGQMLGSEQPVVLQLYDVPAAHELLQVGTHRCIAAIMQQLLSSALHVTAARDFWEWKLAMDAITSNARQKQHELCVREQQSTASTVHGLAYIGCSAVPLMPLCCGAVSFYRTPPA